MLKWNISTFVIPTKKNIHQANVPQYVENVDDFNNEHLDSPDIVNVNILNKILGKNLFLRFSVLPVKYGGVQSGYDALYL